MMINPFIKKLFALGTGLFLCGAAQAAETTYTWEFSSAAPVMGGNCYRQFHDLPGSRERVGAYRLHL